MEDLLGRNIDLLELRALKNPYFLSEINPTKHLIFSEMHQLAESGGSFDFLKNEEDLYTDEDLKIKY